MSYRFMRLIVMFDLPVNTSADRREYSIFRRYLIKNGFFMLQESIYCKLAPNPVLADSIILNLKKNLPRNGLIHVMKITEKQYASMECILGESKHDVLDTDERVVIF